ncbi:MAG: hypothetical protein MJZ61_06240 [Bacteroidales bacterium]|nr:hypothetical protein [Bacteroidales bacterium]
MKRIFMMAALVAPILMNTSCNNAELQRLQEQNDSLRSAVTAGGIKIDDYFAAFNSIQENLNQIKEKEQIISVRTNNGGELDDNSAEQINDDIVAIYELMLKNKQTIKDLNAKLQKVGLQNSEMAKTVKLLTAQIEGKDKEINDLKDKLSKLNLDVESLNAQVDSLGNNLAASIEENEALSEVVASQDVALNTVNYVIGSKKELIAHGVIDKAGIFKGLKIGDSFDKNYFTQKDLRELTSINLNVKKAQILSSHPSSSYKLIQSGSMIDRLEITDPVAFWERSKFLVIITD